MMQLRQEHDKIAALDTLVVVVGPEVKAAFEKFWNENDLPFTGLPDPDHQVLKRYGQEVSLFKLGRMPAQMIIDKTGMVRYVHYGQSMSDIPRSEELVGLLEELG